MSTDFEVVKRGVVEGLEARIEALEAQLSEVYNENAHLREENWHLTSAIERLEADYYNRQIQGD